MRHHPAAPLEPAPFAHRDPCALADLGGNLKLIHQPLRTRQTQPQPTACSVPCLHRLLDTGHAWTCVFHCQLDADAAALGQLAPAQDARTGVQHDIPRQFRRHCDNTRHVGDPKPQPLRHFTHCPACADDIAFRANRHFFLWLDTHRTDPRWGVWFSMSRARSTSNAVIAPPNVKPNCVVVIATLGRIPAMTVRPPMSATICAVSAMVRAKKESSVSTAEMSRITLAASDCCIAANTFSCSADTVASSGSTGIVTMSTSRTLITAILSSAMASGPLSRPSLWLELFVPVYHLQVKYIQPQAQPGFQRRTRGHARQVNTQVYERLGNHRTHTREDELCP